MSFAGGFQPLDYEDFFQAPSNVQQAHRSSGWYNLLNSFAGSFGISSILAVLSTSPYLFDTFKLLILGTLVETGRRFIKLAMERYKSRCMVTAQFYEGDPAYEWMLLFLTEQKIWRKSRDFRVAAKSSQRQWNVSPGLEHDVDQDVKSGNAEYLPTYSESQVFRWNGYWLQTTKSPIMSGSQEYRGRPGSMLHLTILSFKMSVLTTLVEEARSRYVEVTRPNVTIHLAQANGHAGAGWGAIKTKIRRPLSSIILEQGVIESLIDDAREFLRAENWYVDAGIPHRRGYLLFGPPGTGKSSTIEALAGELGVEIYSLSLSSGYLNDSFLQAAVSAVPKRSILLLEDIDCAFPTPREDADDAESNNQSLPYMSPYGYPANQSAVTLSGVLNVIDGIGSEEGKLFIATTNHIERLDPALLRPGRIDKKIEYSLASKAQALALFHRFFPPSRFTTESPHLLAIDEKAASAPTTTLTPGALHELAEGFAASVPEKMFSTAELQGYLLSCKTSPQDAARGIEIWAEEELTTKKERIEREQRKKDKAREAKERKASVFGGFGLPSATGNGWGGYPASAMLLPPTMVGPSPILRTDVSPQTNGEINVDSAEIAEATTDGHAGPTKLDMGADGFASSPLPNGLVAATETHSNGAASE